MENSPPPIPNMDIEHLDLLVTFHYVVAGLGALFACFPFLHIGMGIMMLVQPQAFNQGVQNAPSPPAFMAYMFIIMGAIFILLGWAAAVCTFISARYLKHRRKRMFSFVMACFLCMFFPFGTALGVFTLIVLSRDSVRQLYLNQN
jgi:H+/Cl- antiporter ClcA